MAVSSSSVVRGGAGVYACWATVGGRAGDRSVISNKSVWGGTGVQVSECKGGVGVLY